LKNDGKVVKIMTEIQA